MGSTEENDRGNKSLHPLAEDSNRRGRGNFPREESSTDFGIITKKALSQVASYITSEDSGSQSRALEDDCSDQVDP